MMRQAHREDRMMHARRPERLLTNAEALCLALGFAILFFAALAS